MTTTPRPLLLMAAAVASTALLAGCGTATAPVPAVSGTPAAVPPAAPSSAPSSAVSAAPSSATSAPAAPQAPAPVVDAGAEIDAEDQSGDGTSVVVREAVLTAGPGWIAVRADDDGPLLGSAPLAPGQANPVTVPLTGSIPEGDDELTAVLHLDDGDGAFDPARDPRVSDDDDDDLDDDDIEDDDFDYDVR